MPVVTGVVNKPPGIAEYVFGYPLANRRSLLADELAEAGLEVNRPSYRQLVREDGVPEQYLGNALGTAVQIIRSDTRKAAAHLIRFWGREQDYALGFLFGPTSNKGLLLDVTPLVNRSHAMIEELARYTNSFHAIVAQANLLHHIAKATGDLLTDIASPTSGRHTALAYRSGMIGLILQSNDREVASTYARAVERSPLLSMVESWAFPTYTHDAKLTPDFSFAAIALIAAHSR